MDQHSRALHPGPRLIVAVPDSAGIVPTLPWAKGKEDEGSPMVSEDIARQDGLEMGLDMLLNSKDGVIKKPRDIGESSSADLTGELGGSQFGVSSVQMFHFHFGITPDWDWTYRGTKINKYKDIKVTNHKDTFPSCLCSSYPLPESHSHLSTPAFQFSLDIVRLPCPAQGPQAQRTRQRGTQLQ